MKMTVRMVHFFPGWIREAKLVVAIRLGDFDLAIVIRVVLLFGRILVRRVIGFGRAIGIAVIVLLFSVNLGGDVRIVGEHGCLAVVVGRHVGRLEGVPLCYSMIQQDKYYERPNIKVVV